MNIKESNSISKYYTVMGTQDLGGQVHTLIRFKIPKMSNGKRRSILEAVMQERKTDAMIECFWTRGSLIHKNLWAFDAILITEKAKR